jgi:hypothetical protein
MQQRRHLPGFLSPSRCAQFEGQIAGLRGDLLIMYGSQVLHRGLPTAAEGHRLQLVFASEDVDRHAAPWRDRFNKYLNTGQAR